MDSPNPILRSYDFRLDPQQRARVLDLRRAFERACETVRSVAADRGCSHAAALHAVAYRLITPKRGPGLPSGHAVRAISRVSHQLRAERRGFPDPYPADSLDLDSRTCGLDFLAQQTLAITSLEARHQRGGAARGQRLSLGRIPAEDLQLWTSHHLLGATLIVPSKGPVTLHARLIPAPPKVDSHARTD